MSNVNHQFKCRVFAGKVISVDCPGFPSELFAAKIVDGRITLQNIARKQCRENVNINKSKCGIGSTQGFIAGQQPLANSTPAKTIRLEKENKPPERRFSTPDIVRRVAGQARNSPISSPTAHQRLKLVPLHRSDTLNTPKKLARLAPCTRTNSITRRSACVTQVQILRNLSNLSNFSTPPSPHTADNTHAVPSSPNQTLLTRLISSPFAGSVKWRKCLTPQKTYIRRGANTIQPNKSTTKPSQFLKTPKVLPNYKQNTIINQTKYPPGDGSVVYRRRKLIVDEKVIISPKSFKKQLQRPHDLPRIDKHLPKTRKQYIYSHQLAFDLLTNSSYYPRCAKSLNSLFRRACLNKKSDTILKYQQLIKGIPPLET